MKLCRFYVTGWSDRFGHWVADSIETTTRKQARERFKLANPTLKRIKIYRTKGE